MVISAVSLWRNVFGIFVKEIVLLNHFWIFTLIKFFTDVLLLLQASFLSHIILMLLFLFLVSKTIKFSSFHSFYRMHYFLIIHLTELTDHMFLFWKRMSCATRKVMQCNIIKVFIWMWTKLKKKKREHLLTIFFLQQRPGFK